MSDVLKTEKYRIFLEMKIHAARFTDVKRQAKRQIEATIDLQLFFTNVEKRTHMLRV